ncbi:MAG: N-acetyltransferase [Anaerolineaceae bacterium]|nr:N-acetyltransferase [Anaerolineaceae bacterium]
MDILIRPETENDYFENETVTREAFWNLYVPGCNEHYLVYVLRKHADYLTEFSFVAEYQNKIIGNIFYARSHVINEHNQRKDTLTFGPVSVLPEFQRKGVGSAMIGHTVEIAKQKNYPAIIIYGSPSNYCKHGFKSCKDYQISTKDGRYPYSMLVLELQKDVFQNHSWKYYDSPVYDIQDAEVEEYDKRFPPKAKEYRYTQEEFAIAIRASL